MKLLSLKLRNIRSYKDGTIAFPKGSLLLSGDIGAGKSTILLAMEYALFGVQKAGSAQSLLRHGESSGSVELAFELDGSSITVVRTMRKGSAIRQEECSIFIDGKEYKYTATQLKAKIIDLFGYPKEAASRNIPIFRYTVYTPQEQMKGIMADPEARLATLRKIFGIEKYGNIRNNSSIFTRYLNSESRLLEESSRSLEDKILEAERNAEEMENAATRAEKKRQELKSATTELEAEEKALEEMRSWANEIISLKQKAVSMEAEASRLGMMKAAMIKDAEASAQKADAAFAEAEKLKQSLPQSLAAEEIEQQEGEIAEKRMILLSKKAIIEEEIRKLSGVSKSGACPFCLRKADPEHFISQIKEKEKRLEEIANEIVPIDSGQKQLSEEKQKCRKKEMLAQKISSIEESASERRNTSQSRLAEAAALDEKISELGRSIAFSRAKIESGHNYEEDYKTHSARIKELHALRLSLSSELSKAEQQALMLAEKLDALKKECEAMTLMRSKSARMKEISSWLDTVLIRMTEAIERKVMNALQKEFSSIFRYWFSLLMPEEVLTVRIDQSFSPVIMQNGHETPYEDLSGGERTAIALAYRLSLNKVINMMIESIRTKGLLVLDEPTEGFSSEQLDRVREVINQLDLEQIVMVSHEQKIDTFVDNTVKVYKENHVSRIETS
ncbi:MAG: AAA family ATPase [Candidatus Aenigmarchaeota archaeon]|nr:AAA family ATPase [Candidatus Aenigmarchaeota archaeon]